MTEETQIEARARLAKQFVSQLLKANQRARVLVPDETGTITLNMVTEGEFLTVAEVLDIMTGTEDTPKHRCAAVTDAGQRCRRQPHQTKPISAEPRYFDSSHDMIQAVAREHNNFYHISDPMEEDTGMGRSGPVLTTWLQELEGF